MARTAAIGAAVLCALSWPGAHAAAPVRREAAEVRAAGSARLLYRETHWVLPGDSPQRWVLYRCPDGRAFARKQVLGAGMAPDFALEDGRDGYAEGARGGRAPIVYVREDGQRRERPLPAPAGAVIDAGFDAAVRAHWTDLLAGRAVRLQFLLPSRQRYFPVRVQRIDSIDWNGIRAERLRMRLDAWFGFAVPDVQLIYARQDRRLLQVDGTGNLRDARGRYPQVRIAFAAAAADADAADVEAARRLPLDGRCPF